MMSPRRFRMVNATLAVLLGVALSIVSCSSTPADPGSASADDPLVSLQDAKTLAGVNKLEQQSDSRADQPRPDASAPGACKSVFGQEVAFGTNFTKFGNETYSGEAEVASGTLAPIVVVSQSVGTYAEDAEARKHLDGLIPALKECSALNDPAFNFQITTHESSALELQSPNKFAVIYRVKSGKLVGVSVIGLTNSDQVARKIIEKITSRIA